LRPLSSAEPRLPAPISSSFILFLYDVSVYIIYPEIYLKNANKLSFIWYILEAKLNDQ
jgi:hypothetical protein